MNKPFISALGAVTALALVPTFTAGIAAVDADTYRELDQFMDVFERVRADYVDEVSDEDLLRGAIDGMLASLDPHSSYLDATDFQSLRTQTEGEYGGLGLTVTMEDGAVKVIAPFEDTPADRAGIMAGDYITHIDDQLIFGGTLDEAVEQMRGEPGSELVHMVATAAAYDEGPIAFRYPRGEGVGIEMPEVGVPLEIGRGRILREGTRVAILSLGTRLAEASRAAETLAGYGLSTTVADARFAKPLDRDLLRRLAANHEVLVTVEEGSAGGFGAMVLHALSDDGALDGHGRMPLKVRTMVLPDTFLDHDKPDRLYAQAGLDARAIVARVLDALGRSEEAAKSLIA